MKTITTSDPKLALLCLTRQNSDKMHMLADLMKQVLDVKEACEDGTFTSARTPESMDNVMRELVYTFSCEANCGISAARAIVDGTPVALPMFFDKDYNPVEKA